jgi:hypothetical protein
MYLNPYTKEWCMKQVRPPTISPAPAPTAATIAAQQRSMKWVRASVDNKYDFEARKQQQQQQQQQQQLPKPAPTNVVPHMYSW